MKRFLLILPLLACAALSWAQLPKASDIGAKMYPGWNLGNTMEAGDGKCFTTTETGNLSFETSWQSTTTSQALMSFVKQCGFRSVRIPCAWVMGHVNDSEEVSINTQWMNRVHEIVDYCINEGLYVVLNDHWDGGWLENNLATYDATTALQLKTLWTQIANEFKDYDEHLLFAGFNEPDCNVNNKPQQTRVDALMQYEQDFVDAVRATGGNNGSRTLIVQAPSTSVEHACQYQKMPTDVIEGRMMVEVHYYTPPQFTGVWENNAPIYFWGQGNHISSGSYTKYNSTWGEESYMKEQMEMMKKNFSDKGIPVILGEYGANWRSISNTAAQKKHDASIKAFHRCMNQYAVSCGAVPFVWDINVTNQNGTNGIMTVIDRYQRKIFCSVAMEGIQEGVQAATWPFVSAIEEIESGVSNPIAPLQSWNLSGQPTSGSSNSLVITRAKKYVVRH